MQKDGGCAERWWLYAERQRLNATPHETIQDGGSACRKMVAGCRKMMPKDDAERWWLIFYIFITRAKGHLYLYYY